MSNPPIPVAPARRTLAAVARVALLAVAVARATAVAAGTPITDVQAAKLVAGCAHTKPVTGADAKGRFSACFQGGDLVYIEDRAAPARGAPPATATTRYFYDQGALVYARSDSAPQATGGGPSAAATTVPVIIEWTPAGEARRAVRIEHYGEVKLGDADVARLRARGLALAVTARAARPAP